jgi:hypothetical protein
MTKSRIPPFDGSASSPSLSKVEGSKVKPLTAGTLLILVILVLVSVPVFAQVDTAWVRRYNGPGNGEDEPYAITIDDSGNVYVTGYSIGIGTSSDYATMKYYPDGDTAWVRRYNGPGSGHDWPEAIAVDGSGNVYVTGWSNPDSSYTYWFDYATIKYDANGNRLWVRRYDYPENIGGGATAIAVDASGDVYVTGCSHDTGGSYYDYATIKYYPNGDVAWVKRYNGPGSQDDWAEAIAMDSSGNVYVTGPSARDSSYPYNYDYATVKYDANGNQLWVRRYEVPGDSTDWATALAADGSCNIYVTGISYGAGSGGDYATIKYDPSGNQVCVRRYNGLGNGDDWAEAIAVDGSGNVYVAGWSLGSGTTMDYTTIKYDPNGNELWVRRYNGQANGSDEAYAIAVDDSGNVYVTGRSEGSGTAEDCATIKYYPNGDTAWVIRYNGPGNSYDRAKAIAVGDSFNVYVTAGSDGDYATIKYVQGKTLVLKDGSASHDSIPNQNFVVYKVHNDPPNVTQDSLGVLTTDSLGRMCLPKDWFKVGDSVKVEKIVHTEQAKKHQSILRNMYYIKIDNGKFDSSACVIYYDTLTTEAEQEVIVGHTTVMYDLLVSVEWDADQQYLENLLEGFRYASNYLYDVTDGQLYFRNVIIYDNKVNWDQGDVWIHAYNEAECFAHPPRPGNIRLGGIIFRTDGHIYLPRILYFNNDDANRNLTYTLYPYDWTIALTNYWGTNRVYPPARTLAHEFGHYGIGFRDEYCDADGHYIFDEEHPPVYDFGLMDDNLKVGVPQNSEMSCAAIQYWDPTHKVTRQWTDRGGRSCWDYFQWNFQEVYGGIFALIRVPTTQMFAGPNDNLQNLNYDVGRLIPSAGAINDYLGGARTVIATLFDQNGEPLPKAKVSLKKFYDTDSSRIIEQGKTADSPYAGQIRCLGYNNWTDEVIGSCAIVIEGKRTEGWLFGKGQIGKSGLSGFQNSYRSSLDGDSLDLFLRAVIGDYPLIYGTSLSSGTPEYLLYTSHPFSTNPNLELHPDGAPAQTYILQPTPTGYAISIPDSMGSYGTFTLLALDDSAYTFFVNTPYCFTEIVDTAFADIIIGPQGGCELYLDNLNSSLEKILVLSSPYPPIRTGLDQQSEQAGEIYSLSSYPSGTLLGSNSVVIHYANSDLHTQSEATLGLFKWNESLQQWEGLCGFVDTLNNVVGANIDSLGVYAAFTTGYLRGDANGDGVINVVDVVYLINYLFINGPAPDPVESGDVNCDHTTNAADVVYLINYLFIDGPPPCE